MSRLESCPDCGYLTLWLKLSGCPACRAKGVEPPGWTHARREAQGKRQRPDPKMTAARLLGLAHRRKAA